MIALRREGGTQASTRGMTFSSILLMLTQTPRDDCGESQKILLAKKSERDRTDVHDHAYRLHPKV
jgi:hypothetical protein